jgi:outer membrane protein OmpA-like peptidoglycan-associated protein
MQRYLFLLALLCVATSLVAQPRREIFSVTLSGGLAVTTHSSDLQQTPQILDCGPLASGTDVLPFADILILAPLSSSLSLGGSVGFFPRSVSFTRTNEYPTRSANGTEQTLTTQMDVAASLSYLEINPVIAFPLFSKGEGLSVQATVGPRFALPITSRFRQTEAVVSPSNGFLVVGGQRTTERVIADEPFTSRASLLVGATAAARAVLPLSSRVSFVPNVAFDWFGSSVLTDAAWSMISIRGGFGIQYTVLSPASTPPPPPPPPPPVAPPPPVRVQPPVLAIGGIDFDGEVRIGNTLVATAPILNAVFFDSASATIPASYAVERTGRVISPDPVEAHNAVLVRIADVLASNPQGRVQIVGATSGQATEPEGLALAQRRAAAVRDALVRLGVAENRITTSASILPRVPSNQDFAEGRAENRRVDINVTDAPLQEWVSSTQYAELHGEVLVKVNSTTNGDVSVFVDTERTSIERGGTAARVPILRRLAQQQSVASFAIRVQSEGLEHSRDTTISVARLPRKEVELRTDEFDAVLRFDYNSSSLSSDVKALLAQLAQRLPAGRTIVVNGSTDILGTDQRNKELTEQRARVTQQFLQELVGGRNPIVVETTTRRFSDATPQGRFLNRSIRITTR